MQVSFLFCYLAFGAHVNVVDGEFVTAVVVAVLLFISYIYSKKKRLSESLDVFRN